MKLRKNLTAALLAGLLALSGVACASEGAGTDADAGVTATEGGAGVEPLATES